ncbi:MAG: cytochrome c3 family protein [Nitrospirae bacterium]|nr:cytochrome c3 family protein [Nitrospirota bacterium]
MKRFIMFSIIVMAAFISTPSYPADRSHLDETIDQSLKSQFFCGYCHVMTYPKVMKKAYESWKVDKHNNIRCVECHYPPERLDVKIPAHERIPRDEVAALMKTDWEYMNTELAVLSRLITILNMDESVVRTRPSLDDRNCTTSRCHPTTGKGKEGEFWTKKINFVESEREDKSKRIIPYVHKTHFDKTKWVEGQELHCTTCHQRQTGQKHFEVSREQCFLCHFKNTVSNEGRSKCSLCHEIPTKSLQKKAPEPGAKLITHQTIETDKVSCNSCHSQHINGNGQVKVKQCLDCHDNEKNILDGISNRKLMHEEHVAEQNARCFNCHEPIEHKKADFLDASRETCSACHPDHHISQKVLLAGPETKGVSETPSLMFDVKTNCLGCHTNEKIVKGEKVMHGDPKTCAQCHVEKTAQMVDEWKGSIEKAMKEAKDLEKESEEALANAKGKASDEKLKEASAMFNEARQNVRLVEAGGGVHNQKYSIQLLDAAMNSFEDLIDLLKE